MSLLDAITTFKTGDYTVTRESAGAYVSGRWVAGGASTFSIAASVQPYGNGDSLQPLPDGRHANDVRVVYTTTELRVGDERTATTPDRVAIDGDNYETYAVETWRFGTATTHYRAYVSRLKT